jgi:hypothetical protein
MTTTPSTNISVYNITLPESDLKIPNKASAQPPNQLEPKSSKKLAEHTNSSSNPTKNQLVIQPS